MDERQVGGLEEKSKMKAIERVILSNSVRETGRLEDNELRNRSEKEGRAGKWHSLWVTATVCILMPAGRHCLLW